MPEKKDFGAWEAKYYPVPAEEVPREQAARASLCKWRGLTPEVLAEYGIERDGNILRSGGRSVHFVVADTCALCYVYERCGSCLFVEANVGKKCSAPFDYGVYDRWRRTGNAGPMIAALEKAAKLEEERYET